MHEIIKLVANYAIVIPLVITLGITLRLKLIFRRGIIVSLLLGGVISLLLAFIASHIYNDPRPFVQGHFTPLLAHAQDNGFPSDHTLLASFLGWTLYIYARKWGVVSLVVAALIGGARMAGGVHHLSDIIGSFVISGIATYAVDKLLGIIAHKQEKTHPRPEPSD